MYGTMMGQEVTVLKYDGSNTNVLSKTFVERHWQFLNVQKASFTIDHSKKDPTKVGNEIVVDTELELGDHVHRSNSVIADCRYDVMLEMAWHVKSKTVVEYDTG